MSEFKQSLFGCFDNCTVCLLSFFCPCYVFGKIAEKVGDSCLLGATFILPPAFFICGAIIREKVRKQKGIAGGVVADFCTFYCCTCCALAQEANEVNAFNDSLAQSMARE